MGDSSLQSEDKDPLKDLRITESNVCYYPDDFPRSPKVPVTIHVSPSYFQYLHLLTVLSLRVVRQQADIHVAQVSPKIGWMGRKITWRLRKPFEITNGIQSTTLKKIGTAI